MIFINNMEVNYQSKSRHILSLAERVEVIREYGKPLIRPSLQSLAHRFECSSNQIKNILINREEILESYRKSTRKDVNDILRKRQENIAFLSKVVYEYIQRMLYFNQKIDDQIVRQKALQIKECIDVGDFEPTKAWMEHFKKTYGILAFDSQSLRNSIVITEAKRPHLSVIDMIQYVSRMEQESGEEPTSNADINDNRRSSALTNHSSLEPKIVYEIKDEEDEDLQKSPAEHNSSSNTEKHTVKRRASSPFPDIETTDEALKYVKALEEYAMLHHNFRAIGLLTQLEQIFQKQEKK